MDANPGPVDGSVLYDQEKHVSAAVWEGQERGALRCHEHTSKLGEWKLTPKQIELVEKAGFGYLRKIPAISLDNPLISALVERWRRETNTFHFTVGEMTVTLQDVALLLGLAIDGKPVIGITHTTCSSVCERLLGRPPDSTYASGGMVKLSWLKEFFSHCPENAPIEEVERCTRAYLLYLVGSTIFSTTTGNKVPVMYLPLFEDFEEAGRYAWGAAALAFLYRALGNACVKSQSTICGCLTLLQCWSYFHLNIGRPKLNRDPIHDHFPFVLRWKGKQSGPTANRDVIFYRKALDLLKPNDVDWLPYKYMDSTVIPEDIKSTLILGRSKTMLICFDKAERHLPDRCLRQYGLFQPIPEDVERWVRKSRGVDGGVDLSGKMESELNEWSDRRLNIVDGDDGVDETEYMQWYLKITRKVVGRPISLSSEFQRTISGLREIAYLADSFSTKGLDGQQFESISRIRFIAQDCLRDQAVTGSPVTPSATPQIELGKRTRGKERVRRKGSGKRRRKDELMGYHDTSEDEQPHFYSTVIVSDQMQLHQTDAEVGQLHLVEADDENYADQLPVATVVADNGRIPVGIKKADVTRIGEAITIKKNLQPSYATSKIKDLPFSDASAMEIDDSKVHDPTIEMKDSQLNHTVNSETGDFQPCDASKGLDSRAGDVATKEVGNPQLHNKGSMVKESQVSDATEGINDSELAQLTKVGNDSDVPNAPEEAKESQLPVAMKDVNGLQPHDATNEANDSQLYDDSKGANDSLVAVANAKATDSQLPDSTKVASDSQLAVATEENDSQLANLTNEANDSEIANTTIEANDLQLSDVTEKANDSQHTDASNEANESQVPDATKEANSQLQDETEEGSDSLHLDATKEENDSQHQEATKEGKYSQHLDAIKEGNGSQHQEAIKEGNDSQHPDATKDGKDDSKLSNATKQKNDPQLPDPVEEDNSLLPDTIKADNGEKLPEATEKAKDIELLKATEVANEPDSPDSTIKVCQSKHSHTVDKSVPSNRKSETDDAHVSSTKTVEIEDAENDQGTGQATEDFVQRLSNSQMTTASSCPTESDPIGNDFKYYSVRPKRKKPANASSGRAAFQPPHS